MTTRFALNRKFAAAALALTMPLVGLAAPAGAYEVTPNKAGGCRLMATSGDLAVMRAYDDAYLDSYTRLLKERVPGVAADVDAVAKYARESRNESIALAVPANINDAMTRINNASVAAGFERHDEPGTKILSTVRDREKPNRDRLEQISGVYGHAQSVRYADAAKRGDFPDLYWAANVELLTVGKSAKYKSLVGDAHAAIAPQMDAFKKRTQDAFEACRDGRELKDTEPAFPPSFHNKNYQGLSQTKEDLNANAKEAARRGQAGAAITYGLNAFLRTIFDALAVIGGKLLAPIMPGLIDWVERPRS